MNNKLNTNFSLKKLLLTALVTGPLATLPAPLWALPSTASSNLTVSTGVVVQSNGTNAINISAPDKAVLTWNAFGSITGAVDNSFNSGDVINYSLPSATSSILNNVFNANGTTAASVINGQITSNGNVYFLNTSGIVIGSTAQINVGGFYASTLPDNVTFFPQTGALSFLPGSTAPTASVVVQGNPAPGNSATIQATGPGNNIYLVGAAVDVQGGKFYGNLFTRAFNTANALTGGVNTSFATTAPVSINTVGLSATGGGLNVASNGGNVSLNGNFDVTVSPGVTATPPAQVSINTTGTTVNGNIIQQPAATGTFTANTTGTVVTLNAGTGTTAGNISLGGVVSGTAAGPTITPTPTPALSVVGGVDFATVSLSGNNITITDKTGDLALGATNAAGTLSVTTVGTPNLGTTFGNISSAGTVTAGGAITILTPLNTSVAITGAGNITFTSIGTTSTLNITSSGDINLPTGNTVTRAMSVVSTGGQITAGSLTTGSTMTLTANSSSGKITVGSLTAATSTFTSSGDINLGATITSPVRNSGGSTMNITSSGGNISLGAISSASTLSITATVGSITTGTINSNTLNITAAQGNITTTGNVNLGNTTNFTTPQGSINVNGTITTNSALNLSAPSASGSINTGLITSNQASVTNATVSLVNLTAGGSIALAGGTIPFLSVTSTGGSITQNAAITSTSKATFNAASDITLGSATNNFTNVVLVGGANFSGGFSVTDSDSVIIGGGTNAKAPTTITVGGGAGAAAIQLGALSTDSLTFSSTLTLLQAAGTLNNVNSSISTVANSVNVFGNVTITTQGNNNASLGNNNFGNASNYGFGQITANVGSGSFSVYESTTLNLGGITAGTLDARSFNGDIVNTNRIAVTGNSVFAAGSFFSQGNITLNNSTNAISSLPGSVISIGNAKDVTLTNTNATILTAGSNQVNGKAATGTVAVTITGSTANSLTLNTSSLGDFNVVGFSAPGAVTINDPSSITIQNATNVLGTTGAVTVNANGQITLGSGIALGGTGITTFNSNYAASGTAPGIVDSAAGIRIFGETVFNSAGNISITNPGHSFGTVSLTTTGAATAAVVPAPAAGTMGQQNITFTEGGTLVLRTVSVGTNTYPGTLTLTSTGGSIIQAQAQTVPTVQPAGTIVVQTNAGNNAVTLSAPAGSVVLNNAGNLIASSLNLTALGNSSYTQTSLTPATLNTLYLGNVAVTNGTFTVDVSGATTSTATQKIAQYAGTSVKVYGNASFSTFNGSINLGNTGNNFGGLTLVSNKATVTPVGTAVLAGATVGSITNTTPAFGYAASSTFPVTLTGGGGTGATATATTDANGVIVSYNVVNAGTGYTTAPTVVIPGPLGADVTVTEAGVLNLLSVNTGTSGKFTATSENASIIQSGSTGLNVGGTTSLTAVTGVTLGASNNTFNGSGIAIVTPGNVTLSDSSSVTVLAGGTKIGGTATYTNSFANGGTIRDGTGVITIEGNVYFDAGIGTNSNITLQNSTLSLGAVKFKTNTATISESTTLNLAAGSLAIGPVTLSSGGNIVTSGAGGATFQNTLSLNALGSITISNPFTVLGANNTVGLTFSALGAVDLSTLSLAGNLNNITPRNLGAASYKQPGS